MARTPLETLTLVLEAATAGLSSKSQGVVRRLALGRGYFHGADSFARSVGFHDRHQLAYHLRCEGLPPLRSLARWIRIMVWVVEHEGGGASFCEAALLQGRDPAYRYHLIKDVLGIQWTALEKRGFAWLVLEFMRTCLRAAVDKRTNYLRWTV